MTANPALSGLSRPAVGIRRPAAGTVAVLVLLFTAGAAQAGGRHDDDATEAAEEAYDRAGDLHKDRQYDQAAQLYVSSYKAGYREETSAYNAACAFARAGKADEAFRWLETAYQIGFSLEDYLDDDHDLRSLRSDPRYPALREKVYNGNSSTRERQATRLLQKYRAVVADRSADAEDYGEIARDLLDVERYDEAAQAYLAIAAQKENKATALYNAACSRALQGRNGPALDLLRKAVEEGFADPRHLDDDDDLDGLRGEARYKQIRALAAELEVPDYAAEWKDRTPKLIRKWRDAMPRIEAATRRYPQLGQTWFNLGFAHITFGQGAQAVQPFEKAVELGYRKSDSLYNLACAHALAGHRNEAFAWLDKAVNSAEFDNWWMLRQDADLDEIRTDPRFKRFLDLARAHERRSWTK